MTPLIWLTIVAVSATAAVPLSQRTIGGRIIGGHEVKIEGYPYQVSVQLAGQGHRCGGSIISKDYIVTASHCVKFFSPERLSVRSGTSFHKKGGLDHKIVDGNFHPRFDIAIVKIEPQIVFDETRQPIELARVRPEDGRLANVSGWGYMVDGSGVLAEKLQAVEVPIVSQKDCRKAHRVPVLDHEICAGFLGVGGKDACQGDTGGPLVVDKLLVGVVSWGSGCAEPEHPHIYVDVAYLRDWIKEETGV